MRGDLKITPTVFKTRKNKSKRMGLRKFWFAPVKLAGGLCGLCGILSLIVDEKRLEPEWAGRWEERYVAMNDPSRDALHGLGRRDRSSHWFPSHLKSDDWICRTVICKRKIDIGCSFSPGEKVRMRASVNTNSPNNGVDQLCPNCGLCCDSTLFADVELRAGDDAKRRKKLGLTILKKTPTKPAFAQPCACFDGKLCGIYSDRPKCCRLFECGLLKRVEADEMTAGVALKKIFEAKKRIGKVCELLRSLGQRDERMALTHRYGEAMSAPVDFSDETDAERRGELMMAVNDLMTILQRDFLR